MTILDNQKQPAAPLPPELVSFDVTIDNSTIKVGGAAQLSITNILESGSTADPSYTSSDELIATVDGSGAVTAVAVGVVTFTAEASEAGNQENKPKVKNKPKNSK